jgi:hypothetical protein
VEGVAFDALAQRSEVVSERLRVLVEIDEDEPFPHLAAHRYQAELTLVDVEELVLLLDVGQIAVEAVAPGVVLAGELSARA